jgi:transposase
MFSDEGRFGRITDPHGCWAPAGVRPTTHCQMIREYTYAYAAVSPADGELDTLILPNMYTSTFCVFLQEVARRHPEDFILWIHDGAPSHRSGALVVPNNIRLVELPPYSPELNPVEHLWEEMREKEFWNRTFRSMRAVERAMVLSLRRLEQDRPLVTSMTSFPWIMRSLAPY